MTETSEQSVVVASLPAALTELRLENESSKKGAAAPKPCYFLDKIPREIRDMIYGYLLINESLSTLEALSGWEGRKQLWSGYAQCGLAPQILRTCHQINAEGSYSLYHLNKFMVLFGMGGESFMSPVMRNILRGDRLKSNSVQSRLFAGAPAFKHVKNWRFMIPISSNTLETAEVNEFNEGLVRFCRLLSLHPPKSLEVQLMPKGLFHEDYRRSFELGPCLNPEILLKPLKLLRNIPRFQLGELEKVDVPDTARSSVPVQSIAIRPEYREDLTRLVQGNSHSLRVFEIYEKLLAYAQSFERHRPFSVYMDSKWDRARDQHGARLLGPEDIWYRAYQKKFDPLKAHPFKKFLRHPVEMNLEIASLASEDNDLESFRSARKAVIQYLEPQYKRIKAASSELKEFIKHEKQNPGPCPSYCPYPYFQTCEEVIYLSLIEDYHQSFVRDAPTNIRRVMHRWQREFELIYSTGKREIAIKKLSNWVELLDMTEGSRRTPGWRVWAKEAVDDMDEQYFQIQASRKALFEADPDGDYGCGEFDAENSRSDEMVESSTPPDLGSDYGCGEFDVESYRSDERADYNRGLTTRTACGPALYFAHLT